NQPPVAPDDALEEPGNREAIEPTGLPVSLAGGEDEGQPARPPVRLVGAGQGLEQPVRGADSHEAGGGEGVARLHQGYGLVEAHDLAHRGGRPRTPLAQQVDYKETAGRPPRRRVPPEPPRVQR